MRIKYFETANQDFIKSPGWFKRLLIMGLLFFIPIFGFLVVYSYLYGWGREAAFGVRRPLPQRIFGNEDGQLYRRGGRILVVQIVYSLLPTLIMGIASFVLIRVVLFTNDPSVFAGIVIGSLVFFIVFIPLMLGVMLVTWAGCMRTTVYGTIRAGLQLGEIFKMFKRDLGGIFRIFGMYLLITAIVTIIVETLLFIVFAVVGVFAMGFAAGSGASGLTAANPPFAFAGFGAILFELPFYYVMYVGILYPIALSIRALGYWVRGVLPDLWQAPADGGAWGAAPQPGYAPAPQQGYAPPQQGYAPPQPGYAPAPQPGYAPAPQQGYAPVPSPGYVQPQQGYAPPPPPPGYVPPQQGYAPPPPGYAPPQQPVEPQQGYVTPQQPVEPQQPQQPQQPQKQPQAPTDCPSPPPSEVQ